MNTFRTVEFDEKKTLINGVTEINKEKHGINTWNTALIAILYVILLLIFVGMHYSSATEKITLYNGLKPEFEKYEDYIMSNFFYSSYDTSQIQYSNIEIPTDGGTVPFIWPGMGIQKKYKQVMEPEEYDYTQLDLRHVDNRRIILTLDLPKNTKSYKVCRDRVKELFDEEMNRRAEAARSIGIKDTIIAGIFLVLYALGAFLIRKMMVSNCQKRLDQIQSGKCLVAKATLIGREKISRYRSSSALYLEAQTEDGERVELRVRRMQYEGFASNTPCFLIKYDDDYGAYDQYDIVWNGLKWM